MLVLPYNETMKNQNYYTQRNIQDIDKIAERLEELPPFCEDYFLGIETRTSCQTRLKYAYDLRIFFDFLCKRRYRNKEVLDLTLEDLEQINAEIAEKLEGYVGLSDFLNRCAEQRFADCLVCPHCGKKHIVKFA